MKFFKRFQLAALGLSILLFACATTNNNQPEDVSQEDDAFRQELLRMLEEDEDQQPEAEEPAQEEQAEEEFDESDFAQLFEEEETTEQQEPPADFQLEPEPEEEESEFVFPDETAEQSTQQEPVFQDEPQTEMPQTRNVSESLQETIAQLEHRINRADSRLDSLLNRANKHANRLQRIQNKIPSERASRPVAPAPTQQTPPAQPVSERVKTRYRAALAEFNSYHYNECIASMRNLLQSYPNSALAGNFQYWIGESYYGLGQFQRAVSAFEKVFNYSTQNKHDDAQIMIALSYMQLGQREKANSEFAYFLESYPNSDYISIARRYYQN